MIKTSKQIDKNCSICLVALDSYAEPTTDLPCGHRFHTRCINDWEVACQKQGINKSCPYCRQPIENKSNYRDLELSNRIILLQHGDHEQFPDNQYDPDCCLKVGIIISSLIAIAAEGAIFFFFISNCGDLFTNSGDYPIFSVGTQAKGYIAIGFISQGIVSIGMLSEGMFSLGMIGYGILGFVGQIGGGLGFGIYQVGISWYCYLGQISISVWATFKAQLGINIISPMIYPERQHYQTCQN